MPFVPSLVDRFRTHFLLHTKPRSFRRVLRAESLEHRLALTAGTGVEAIPYDPTLSLYLAQAPEMGPVAPPADSPVAPPAESLDAHAVDAALASLVTDPAAEGESVALAIVDFQVYRDSGWVYASGRITSPDPTNSYVSINGVQFWAEIAGVDSAGNFMLVRADEGGVGVVEAYAYDFYGNSSEKAIAVLC